MSLQRDFCWGGLGTDGLVSVRSGFRAWRLSTLDLCLSHRMQVFRLGVPRTRKMPLEDFIGLAWVFGSRA